jgi:hypothetical protein
MSRFQVPKKVRSASSPKTFLILGLSLQTRRNGSEPKYAPEACQG